MQRTKVWHSSQTLVRFCLGLLQEQGAPRVASFDNSDQN
jgi:hypothetical protein